MICKSCKSKVKRGFKRNLKTTTTENTKYKFNDTSIFKKNKLILQRKNVKYSHTLLFCTDAFFGSVMLLVLERTQHCFDDV